MFSAAFLITYAEGLSDDDKLTLRNMLETAAAELSDTWMSGDTIHDAAMNDGDFMLEIGFADEEAWSAAKGTDEWTTLMDLVGDTARVALFDYAAFGGTDNMQITSPDEAGAHRLLFTHVVDDADPAQLERSWNCMIYMQDHVEGFVNSRLCKTVESMGHNTWDYVFECEYTDPSVYPGPYLMHPIHVTFIDRFFEPACREYCFAPDLCTAVIAADHAFLGNCVK